MHSKCVEMHSNANFIKPGFPKEGHICLFACLFVCLFVTYTKCESKNVPSSGISSSCHVIHCEVRFQFPLSFTWFGRNTWVRTQSIKNRGEHTITPNLVCTCHYVTYAHNYFTWFIGSMTMDSCFGLVRPHQRDIVNLPGACPWLPVNHVK